METQKTAAGTSTLKSACAKVLSITALVATAATAQAQTLPELLAAASASHPSIQAAKRSELAANMAVDSAKGGYWPTVSMVLEAGGDTKSAPPSKFLRIEQTLWDWGGTDASVKAATEGERIAQLDVASQTQQVQLQVVSAWQAARAALGRTAVAESLEQRLREHEAMMSRRVQAEASTPVELQLIRSQVLATLIEKRKAMASYVLAVQRLEQLTGKGGIGAGLKAQPVLDEPGSTALRMRQVMQMTWGQIARLQPQVVKSETEVLQVARQVDLKRAQLQPQLYARVDRTFSSGAKTNGFMGVRYSLDAGNSRASEIKGLEAKVSALQASHEAAILLGQEQIQKTLNELEESAQRFESLKLAVSSSRAIHESYVRQFVAGKKSWLDVMTAIRDVAQNEYALNDAMHLYWASMASLDVYESAAIHKAF